MLPAIIFTILFGLMMMIQNESIFKESYFYLKLIFVFFLFAFHGYMIKHFKQFKNKTNIKKASYFRKINEVPTILMILIIIFVVVKPDII